MTMTRTSIRRRGGALLVALLLVLALALAACGGRGAAQRGGYAPSNVTTQQTNNGGAGTGTDLSGDEQQIDSLMNQLNGTASDATFDYSSLDTPAQP